MQFIQNFFYHESFSIALLNNLQEINICYKAVRSLNDGFYHFQELSIERPLSIKKQDLSVLQEDILELAFSLLKAKPQLSFLLPEIIDEQLAKVMGNKHSFLFFYVRKGNSRNPYLGELDNEKEIDNDHKKCII